MVVDPIGADRDPFAFEPISLARPQSVVEISETLTQEAIQETEASGAQTPTPFEDSTTELQNLQIEVDRTLEVQRNELLNRAFIEPEPLDVLPEAAIRNFRFEPLPGMMVDIVV